MRVYHLLSKKWALDNMRRRRLRISNLEELNDPFEFMSCALPSPSMRMLVHNWRRDMARSYGLICFSTRWSNPVLWSHYGDRHRGIALGFDIADAHLKKVDYAAKRARSMLKEITDHIHSNGAEERMQKLLFTKYRHWSYESEMRCFLSLDPSTVENGNYFSSFSDDMRLREVIVGAMSDTTREEVSKAILGLDGVNPSKARLAFNSFRVVRNRNQRLWE